MAASMIKATLLESLAAGIAGGILLAAIGLRHTRFESTAEGQFYTPHTYIGLLVMALFIARIAYRIMSIYVAPRALAPPENPFGQYQRSPLTLAVFGLLIGYYVVFNLGILRLSRTAEPPRSHSLKCDLCTSTSPERNRHLAPDDGKPRSDSAA